MTCHPEKRTEAWQKLLGSKMDENKLMEGLGP